ncbi:hypothetical protein Rs2_38556 [Raphanus sativus]|nr:hypothetical protein Rs2_38556 [Raphanus sativus]
MTSKLRFTKKKKESPPKKKKESSPAKKKKVEPAKKTTKMPTGKKKRSKSSPAEEHEADDGGSSSQPTKRPHLTSNCNPKKLQPNPVAASASPTLAASPTQPDNEEAPLGPPVTSEDPPPTKTQNPTHQEDPPDASLSGPSTKGGTPSSEQGDNEEMGSHGEPPTSREPNATEEQIMGWLEEQSNHTGFTSNQPNMGNTVSSLQGVIKRISSS